MVVQHDLKTVGEYLDQVSLINQTLVASGDVEKVFSQQSIDETYSGRSRIDATQFKGDA